MWGPDFYTQDTVNAVREIEFRFFNNPESRLAALEQGDAQIIGNLPPGDARSLNTNPNIHLLPVPIPGQPLQFFFNTTIAPTDTLQVRQALIYSLNRTSVAESIFGGFSPVAWGPIAANTLYYNRGVQNVYAYNLQQAQGLFEQAGYVDSDNDSILDKEGAPLSIRILQLSGELLPEVAQLLQEQWQSIGVQVTVQPVPGNAALIEAVQENTYNLVSSETTGLDPNILKFSYLSNSLENWTGYTNPELDSGLLEAEQLSNGDERRLLYGRAQAIILEQALVLPIRDTVNLNGYVDEIQGLRFDPYGWYPLLYNISYSAQ
jgi:peptide/nickel transport system substrate-binding protein